ncbi:glycosyltransferase family 4 protein [Kineococcus indalonis]|uniref:glycosyltransferase family 4 protein n=1 Tax=Kineococcus indalonis TaxID=2696566 RepID=UPI0014136A7F|nr:glycosyltransferase family 4 protein [Kineococcus indalonis]NAZ85052.1 glycosyltransferase [Kineococcus indalonis]
MKISIVYDAVHPYTTGGGERRYHELGTRLAAAGHDVHWYGMKFWDGPRTRVEGGITYHGVCRARPLYTASGRRSIGQALVFGLASLRLVADRHDVVDCCGFPYFSLFAAKLAVLLRGGRLVSTWHEVWGPEYWRTYLGAAGRVGALVEKVAASLPDLVVAASERTRSRFEAELSRRPRVTVVANGADTAAIAALPPAEHGYDVVSAGRLVDFKDVELLLDAVALLVEERPGTTCGVVGDGPHRAALEKRAATLGISHSVTFTGFLPRHDDVYRTLKSSGVFVLTSRREGFGIVVVEAAASGLPVVVAAHPDNAATDLVREGTGVVVEPTAAALAAALRQLLETPVAERAPRSGELAREFSWDQLARDYADVLLGTGA